MVENAQPTEDDMDKPATITVEWKSAGTDVWYLGEPINNVPLVFRVRAITTTGLADGSPDATIPLVDLPSASEQPSSTPPSPQIHTKGVTWTDPSDPQGLEYYQLFGPDGASGDQWFRAPVSPSTSEVADIEILEIAPHSNSFSLNLTDIPEGEVSIDGLTRTVQYLAICLPGETSPSYFLQQPYPAADTADGD